MSATKGAEKKDSGQTGFFSGIFKYLSSFAVRLNPFAEKKLKELGDPDRPDWRKLTVDIWHRPLASLPLDADLPRLAGRVSVEDHRTCPEADLLPPDPYEKEGDPLHQKPVIATNTNLRLQGAGSGASNAAAMNAATLETSRRNYRSVCELLYEIMYVFGGGREAAESARNKFKTELPEDCDIAVQKVELKKYLAEVFGEDTVAGRCVKSLNQAIIAPGNKELLGNLVPGLIFKDNQQRPWQIFVRVFDDHTEVSHIRGQCNLNPKPEASFFFVLETLFVFDKNFENMTDGYLYITEYSFTDKTAAECKAEFSKAFDRYARPKNQDATPPAPARVVSNVTRRVMNYTAYLAEQEAAKATEQKPEEEQQPPSSTSTADDSDKPAEPSQ